MRSTRLLIVCLLLLGGCYKIDTYAPEIAPTPVQPISVASINVTRAPGVDYRDILPYHPAALAEEWLAKRLRAADPAGGRLSVEILSGNTRRDASASQPEFESYTTELVLEFRLYEPGDNLARMTSKFTTRMTREIDQEANRGRKDTLFTDMSKELIAKLNRSLPTHLEQYYGQYLLPLEE